MGNYIITFASVLVTDLLYVAFVKDIQRNNVLLTCLWSTALTLTTAVAIINYTLDHYALIPALLGAFAGTWLGMVCKRTEAT